jgi:hypothetical protein
LFNNKITAKLKIDALDKEEKTYNVGDTIEVLISYLSPFKIVIEQV